MYKSAGFRSRLISMQKSHRVRPLSHLEGLRHDKTEVERSSPRKVIPPEMEVTLVTMYLDLGSFPKVPNLRLGRANYTGWMAGFSRLANPVYALFDDPKALADFQRCRREVDPRLERTRSQFFKRI